jgi:methionine-R-sulfoxide reductase
MAHVSPFGERHETKKNLNTTHMTNLFSKQYLWHWFYGVGMIIIFLLFLQYFFISTPQADISQSLSDTKMDPWKEKLTAKQYAILRQNGTELPYTSLLVDEKRSGTYYAADTKKPVFRSEDKYNSGTGWPSFTRPIKADAVEEVKDETYGMSRTEIRTSEGGHLGHVFTDGPEPSGLRYCINGDALYFVPDSP